MDPNQVCEPLTFDTPKPIFYNYRYTGNHISEVTGNFPYEILLLVKI